MKISSANQADRTMQALRETKALLGREMFYSLNLRDPKMIAFYENHINDLNAMLVAWSMQKPA